MDNKEVVGNIRIKQISAKKKKSITANLIKKFFIWFMFIAMLASFLGPLLYYLFTIISEA